MIIRLNINNIHIFNYLYFYDKFNYLITNKFDDDYKYLLKEIKERYKYKYNYIIDRYPEKIINLFGGLEKMIKYPIIKWNINYLGLTNYIENYRFKYNKLKFPNKICLGYDRINKRAFIIIWLKKKTKDRYLANIFFQRYTNNKYTWATSEEFFWVNGYLMTNNKFDINMSNFSYNINSVINSNYMCHFYKYKYKYDKNFKINYRYLDVEYYYIP